MSLPKTILIRLDVAGTSGPDGVEVLLTHSALKGVLRLHASTLELGEIQLQALRLDKTKTTLEEVIDDTTALIALSGQLKEAVRNLG